MTPAAHVLRPYHHGDLRLALIQSAEVWMAERGNWSFTLREIARSLGVSHNAPYKHFVDKAALLAVLGGRAFDRLSERLAQETERVDPDDSFKRIEATAVGYVAFAIKEPAAFRLMFGEDLARCDDPLYRHSAQSAFALLAGVIEIGVARGELRADPYDTHAATAWALVHGLSLLIIDERLPHVEELASDNLVVAAARTLIDGMRA